MAGKVKISSKEEGGRNSSQYGYQGNLNARYGYDPFLNNYYDDEVAVEELAPVVEDLRSSFGIAADKPSEISFTEEVKENPSEERKQNSPVIGEQKPQSVHTEETKVTPAPVREERATPVAESETVEKDSTEVSIKAETSIDDKKTGEDSEPTKPREITAEDKKPKAEAQVAKEPALAKPSMGINAEAGGGGAGGGGAKGEVETPQLDTTDSNSYVKSLADTAPSSFVKGMTNAGSDIAKARENEQDELKQSFPEMEQPTGLPVKGNKEEKEKTTETGNNKIPEIEVKGKAEGKKIQEDHKQDAKAPVINVPTPKPQEGKPLSEEMLKSINRLPVSDTGVNTSAGPRPKVDLNGQADPQQNSENEQLAGQEVSDLKAQSDLDSKKDFGENDVYPEMELEQLKVETELSASPEFAASESLELPEMDQETIMAFDGQAKSVLDEKTNAEMAKADAEKVKMEEESAKEREDSDKKIKEETDKTEQLQKAEQAKAKKEVSAQRENWQKENETLQKDFKTESEAKKKETQGKIDTEVKTTEASVETELSNAETKASDEKKKTDAEAARKTNEAKNKPKSFWDKVTDAVSSFFDALKAALNTLFDKLRAFVKSVIEAAKKLVNKLIDMARNAIIGLIKAFGELLKKLVNVLLAAFPALRDKINALIDKAVNLACEIVNKLADALKKAVNFLLDALGKVLDAILAAYQAFYNMLLDALAFIAVGLIKIMKGIANLVLSAKDSPGHFWGQMSEEMLGTDVTKPLPNERPAVDDSNVEQAAKSQVEEGNIEQQDANLLAKKKYSPDDFKVEPVANNLELDQELVSKLGNSGEESSVEFGHQNEQENDIEALKQDVMQPQEEEKSSGQQPAMAAATETTVADDGMVGPFKSPMERAGHLMSQMKEGVVKWWNEKKVTIIAALVLGILGVVLANVLTGGAIMAALPLIMQLMSVYFLADTIFNVGKHFGAYLGAAWPGELAKGAVSLARAMAIGAFELVTSLLFGAKGAIKGMKNAAKTVAKQGVKGAMKQGLKTAKNAVKEGVKETFQNAKKLFSVAKDGGKNLLKNGKFMYKGVSNSFAKGAKSLDDLGKRLGQRLKFKKFKIVVKKWRFSLYGEVNPWVLLASGKVVEIDEDALKKLQKDQGAKHKLGLQTEIGGQKGIVIGAEKDASNLTKHLQGNELKGGSFLDHNKELADELLSKGTKGSGIYDAATKNIVKNSSEATNILARGMDPAKLEKIVQNGLKHAGSDMTTLLSRVERLQKFNIETFDRLIAELAHSQANKFKGAEWILDFVSSKGNDFLAKIKGFEIVEKVGDEIRRFDAVIGGKKCEFKNWGDFTNLGDLVHQIRKDFDAAGGSLSTYKYIFSDRIGDVKTVVEKISKRLPDHFSPEEINAIMEHLLDAVQVGK